MAKFRGDFDELKSVVESTGSPGDWEDVAHGKQYRCEDGAILNWYETTGTLQFQGAQLVRDAFREKVESALGSPREASAPKTASTQSGALARVFVVHGHDDLAREQLELVLHRLGLDPFVLANTGGGGLTIIEALEREIGPGPRQTRFGIVLLTPDDMGYARRDGPDRVEPRARQNVVLEMGMLISAIGRPNVAILKKGHLEVPSDAQGIVYIPFNDHVKETVPRLVDRLRSAGFTLDPENITKASS